MEVQDTMGLTAQIAGKMEVTIWDSTIVADFSWTPTFPVTDDPIFCDGLLSHDSEFPDLPMQYKWDWNGDGSASTWIISFNNIKRQLQSGYQMTSGSYAVRCVKEAK